MNHLGVIFMFVFVGFSFAQFENAKWIPVEIKMKSGEVVVTETIINHQFFEGTLITKQQDQILTISPHAVNSFVLRPKEHDSLEFVSISASFLKSNGFKNSFLNSYYRGDNYSIFKKRIPDKNWLPIAVYPYGWGYVQYLQNEVTLFIESNSRAYQISKPSGRNYDKKKYKVEKGPFLDCFGDDSDKIKRYIQRKKLNINRLEDIQMIVEYANELWADSQ